MTFLNPIFLWFLPLISIPIIIHLLAKRKSKLIDFPSLKFLKLLEQDALRKFNIKQLILLIIRTLMILLIILAFARPGLDRSTGFRLNSGSIDLLIFAIDNTASNQSNIENIDRAMPQVFSDELKAKGFNVAYCGLTDLQLHDSMDEIAAEFGDIYHDDFMAAFSEQIDLDRYERKSIFWIGDGQDVRDRMEELDGWSKYLLVTPVDNDAAITNIILPGQGIRLGDTYDMSIELGRSIESQEALSLELLINEKRQNQLVVEEPKNSVLMTARVEEGGYQSGRLILPSDEAAYNNDRHFILPAEGDIPVQILRSKQIPDFWTLIKSSVEDQQLNLDIRVLDYNEIDNMDLSRGGTVIVDAAHMLASYNWERLETFVSTGGQLVLFGNGGSAMMDVLGFKSQLVEEINPFPLGLYLTGSATKTFNTTPLRTIIDQNRLKVFKRYKTGGDELGETWVRFLDDQPFMGSRNLKEGRIVWFNTDFGMSANNLPVLGMFPTLIIQLAQSQAIKAQTDLYNAFVGDTLNFFPPPLASDNSPFSVQRPDGTTDFLSPDLNYVLHYPNTNLPGIYKLSRGRQVLQSMAVNISSHEAQAHRPVYSFGDTDIFVSSDASEITNEILDQGSSLALWPFLFLVIFLLWLAETYLARIKATWRQHV
ncbi:MAG: BatA domain-containing protein [FCB group bacterium]|nr:BatA domain-containing protein [FCB group bacterium]MBL7028762.1 BatA domain-containing protein [Candidatus Neomarinimicrobiota bacterium]MBL7121354.1 BatA domain-containing protein [Candidatus Neomarinimicrobiota bacterium]